MVTKIAIFGSCVSRDNFNSKFNPNHKMFFKCVAYQHQTSILSLMSKKLPESNQNLDQYQGFRYKHVESELNKNFLDTLIIEKPKFLLIDLFGDMYCGAVHLGSGNFLTNNSRLNNLTVYKGHSGHITVTGNNYFDQFKKSFDQMYKFIKRNCPSTKVIIVKTKFTEHFNNGSNLTEIRRKNNSKIIDVDELNDIWEKYNSYLINKYRLGGN